MRSLEVLTAEFIALHAADIRALPTAYKVHVVADPEASARRIIEGLNAAEVAELIRSLKAERRAVARHSR